VEKSGYHVNAEITMLYAGHTKKAPVPQFTMACKLLITLASLVNAQDFGPGTHIPEFRLNDQNGTSQTFESIRGAKGAMVVFYRSADW